ncbi:Skb1 methyltransferase [Exidia glandulosa HHB12029]|uniref:Protein arginine N-methyltransferase n=1 Tax=Exidia glandulosa HHB12029 TaxID=1314781 RepID=A0A165PW17_EXIGL|nr:Skb1 methyltransferase [Exidia glandulosa HHB12029]
MSSGTQIPIALHVPPSQLEQFQATSELSIAQAVVQDAYERKYDVVCMPLTTEAWKTRWQEMCLTTSSGVESPVARRDAKLEERAERWRAGEGFRRDEVTITKLDEAENVIAMASDWIELDSPDEGVRFDSEVALRQEISYAAYLNVHTFILPTPRNRAHAPDYARAVNAAFAACGPHSFVQVSIRIPIFDPTAFRSSSSFVHAPPTTQSVHGSPSSDFSVTWEMWDIIRTACAYSTRLSITLDLTPPLPATLGVLQRWAAEPTRHIFLPASTFIPNAKGYPVLTKATQAFLRDIIKYRPTIILSNTAAGVHTNGGESAYSQYVRHLEKTSPALQAMETPGTLENFAKGYMDYLQAPLQPLMDNLQSMTYEVFEKDPVKYYQYEEAVFRALSDRQPDSRTVICVAGAGRGPLVAGCLRAIERSSRNAVVYAVEKNVNAFVTLQERRDAEWGPLVTIVYGDMRTVELPEKADILVTELLGSFGDNELSPECLDGAMRFLKPDGISIPASYTAHLAPLSSSKLFMEVQSSPDQKFAETPYVVLFQAVNVLSGDGGGVRGKCGGRVQECWEFEHPRRDIPLDSQGLPYSNAHNTRSATLNFHIPHAGVLHGFAGYFEAVLYADVGLSIHPDRKEHISPNMFSWFPIFFPLRDPLYLPANSELQVFLWRLTDKRKVWYEWFAEAFLPKSAIAIPVVSAGGSLSSNGLMSPTPMSAIPAPSPLLDAPALGLWSSSAFADRSANATPRLQVELSTSPENDEGENGRIKIGQTTLHNPSGRSSWIGL